MKNWSLPWLQRWLSPAAAGPNKARSLVVRQAQSSAVRLQAMLAARSSAAPLVRLPARLSAGRRSLAAATIADATAAVTSRNAHPDIDG